MITILLLLATLNTEAQLLDAIWAVESSRQYNPPAGDNGDSIGPYQIQLPYFKDALEHDKSLRKYKYQDVMDKEVAIKVIKAYWSRYATKARLGHEPTLEDLARIHNGGLNGFKKESTKKYWAKVQKAMK